MAIYLRLPELCPVQAGIPPLLLRLIAHRMMDLLKSPPGFFVLCLGLSL